MSIWSAFSSADHDFHCVDSVFVNTDKRRIRVLTRDGAREIGQLLGQADHLGGGHSLILRDHVLVLMVVID